MVNLHSLVKKSLDFLSSDFDFVLLQENKQVQWIDDCVFVTNHVAIKVQRDTREGDIFVGLLKVIDGVIPLLQNHRIINLSMMLGEIEQEWVQKPLNGFEAQDQIDFLKQFEAPIRKYHQLLFDLN